MPKGKVTYGDVLEIAPFENRLCILSLDGRKLTELMEQIAAVGGEGISGVVWSLRETGVFCVPRSGENRLTPMVYM